LTEYTGDNIPGYSILSHTWGTGEEEVTFEDIGNDIMGTKSGYDQLRFCVKQAATNDLQYFWIDTCCIKKSDPVEL
jgi:hypothetical protein